MVVTSSLAVRARTHPLRDSRCNAVNDRLHVDLQWACVPSALFAVDGDAYGDAYAYAIGCDACTAPLQVLPGRKDAAVEATFVLHNQGFKYGFA